MARWFASLAALVALLVLSTVALAADAGRGPDGLLLVPPLARVSDPNSVLTAADRAALEGKLAAFEAKQGSQIAILLVPSTKPEPIEDFAHRVGDAWKIGRKGIGDGVLVVVAIQDRTARIDVARSLEGAIPDVVAGRVVRANMAPHFVNKDYAGGLNEALDVLFARIRGERLAPGPGANVGDQPARDLSTGSAGNPDARIQSLLPFLIGGIVVGSLLRRLLGVLGAVLAAGGALALVGYLFSSLLLGGIAAVVVFVLALFGSPLMLATQVLGGRGGFGGGFGGGGGGFRSGGGGDFSGGGASGNW
jgi:uncharacterized protein